MVVASFSLTGALYSRNVVNIYYCPQNPGSQGYRDMGVHKHPYEYSLAKGGVYNLDLGIQNVSFWVVRPQTNCLQAQSQIFTLHGIRLTKAIQHDIPNGIMGCKDQYLIYCNIMDRWTPFLLEKL